MTTERVLIGGVAALAAGVLITVAGFGAMTVGLAMDVQERGPTVPPQLEADYRQVAYDRGVDWALLAAWDGAVNGFSLPVRSQSEVFQNLYDQALAAKAEAAKQWCDQHPDDTARCPPQAPSLTPQEEDQLAKKAYRVWHGQVLVYVGVHAGAILADAETFARAPEQGFGSVMPADRAARAADLYEGYLLLDELAQEDDHTVELPPDTQPVDWQPVDGFAWPVVGPLTSRFGMRVSPIDGQRRLHAGIDVGVVTGTAVRASKAGVVVQAESSPTYGQMVVVDHGGGYQTLYAHNSVLEVHPGQPVQQGQEIARSGSTGLSTGPHVHFEIHYQGAPVDPLLLLGR